MDLKELKTKTIAELHNILSDFREKLRDFRFKDSSKQLKNIRGIRALKKDIARVLTLINKDKQK